VGPNFDKARFISATKLKVSGKFDTHAEVIDEVIIRILAIPEGHAAAMTKPMVGDARVGGEDAPLNTIDNLTNGSFEGTLTNGSFEGTVTGPTGSYTVAVGDTVRLIGLSVAIKAPEAPDPPGFETFTWCVSRVVEA
jgi:hypothetical protein